jgi:hypothetical protein
LAVKPRHRPDQVGKAEGSVQSDCALKIHEDRYSWGPTCWSVLAFRTFSDATNCWETCAPDFRLINSKMSSELAGICSLVETSCFDSRVAACWELGHEVA